MIGSARLLVCLTCICGSFFGAASAEQLPAWQVGLGGGVLNIPDYRGSDENNTYPYPFVMPILRGRRLQADEDGIRGLIFDSDDVKFDFSLDGSVPVKSDDNTARAGMSDLDPILQFGPMLRIKLWENDEDAYRALSLNLPVRAAFSIGSGVEHRGYTAYPHLTYRHVIPIDGKPWRLGLSSGLLWGTEDFHDYYYEVAPAQATAGRPAYDAQAGFGGGRLVGTFSRAGRDSFMSLFAVYDRLDGANFRDSPLVKRDDGLTVGFVMTYFLFSSDRSVSVSPKRW